MLLFDSCGCSSWRAHFYDLTYGYMVSNLFSPCWRFFDTRNFRNLSCLMRLSHIVGIISTRLFFRPCTNYLIDISLQVFEDTIGAVTKRLIPFHVLALSNYNTSRCPPRKKRLFDFESAFVLRLLHFRIHIALVSSLAVSDYPLQQPIHGNERRFLTFLKNLINKCLNMAVTDFTKIPREKNT
jgi:hypothetical protein